MPVALPLGRAEKLALKIIAELKPFCERIEIAGSIRRGRSLVNDIDIVALPGFDQINALRERVLRNTRPQIDGNETIICRLENGVQVDLWLAQRPHKNLFGETTPTNFGALSEEEIFAALKLEFIPPEKRER